MEEKRTKAKIICDAICGLLMLVAVAVYVVVGICSNVWHPTWVIIVGAAIVCGVIGIVCDTVSNIKKVEEQPNVQEQKDDNK